MIGYSGWITGAEGIHRTATPATENGEAQFIIGSEVGPHMCGYWTVSDLVILSDRLKNLAVELLQELQVRDLEEATT